MTVAQRRNRLKTHFSDRLPVVKRRMSVHEIQFIQSQVCDAPCHTHAVTFPLLELRRLQVPQLRATAPKPISSVSRCLLVTPYHLLMLITTRLLLLSKHGRFITHIHLMITTVIRTAIKETHCVTNVTAVIFVCLQLVAT